ncbi:MAG: Gldg family protein [Bacteroidales bacterium]|jgi:gliding-associated putative ABC transporter substrate-binding component GldG|nr:Gldg family protein [Bacteroidales bacterium]
MNTSRISTTILLVAAIVLIINILSENYSFRLDLTEEREYTLSKATTDILKGLDKPVTITAYFSKDLPPNIGTIRENLKDMLVEYGNRSKGMVVYKFVNPGENEQLEREAVQNGIQPIMINVREKDQVKQQKAWLGVMVSMGEEKEMIPFIQPGSAMEYALSTSIKKLSVVDKPGIALIQGHGEPYISDVIQAYKELAVLYDVQTLTLTDTSTIPGNYKTIAIIRPTDTIPPVQFAILDNYLSKGGNILIALNRVEGDFSNASGRSVTTGLEEWLMKKGITVSDNFIIDATCGSVTLQQQQGGFTMSTQIEFPYLPVIQNFADNPITKGLEAVSMQFASPITFSGDTTLRFTPIAFSSDQSGSLRTPLYFDIQKEWQTTDFPMQGLVVAGILEGRLAGNSESKMIIISDGDFAIGGQGRGNQLPKDNVSLLVNSIDWLSDDTGLIGLRTKGVTSRPIKDMEAGKKSFLKWSNFLAPIILILIYGMLRMRTNRNKRIKRMEVSYE